ncbi:hypothetical protein [Streptomyces sp. CMB-StM0423]|uniref:hypothetical protein n=1 Tax=Streptomyces sp. CMB-StM0423 TaxID=2059884 RepID=UPI000C70D028|nr:hypothetical protein [Streptomyces sp. CMB-StM0423]AUH40887.1 hypothetical protein CXR04_12030 [Streptomyces sp. CMB-StM0423]
MRSRIRPGLRRLAAVVAAAVAVPVVLAVGASGTGGSADAPPAAPAALGEPAYAVEDFAYPGADEILAERGILLKRGNGHITLTDCGPAGLLEVWARSSEKICFQVTGVEGYLSLELPSVYAIKGNDYAATANMTVDGEETSFDIAENSWTPVGESADPEGREHMLVELITAR